MPAGWVLSDVDWFRRWNSLLLLSAGFNQISRVPCCRKCSELRMRGRAFIGWATAGRAIDASGIGWRVGPSAVVPGLMHSIWNPGSAAGRGFNPAGGAPGGG
ncbi:hypothetical protein F511_14143 [Dorcoceras hygrometricum]|uniref:Uncharacterized protein n=1 Tax=Dorcoceras hygrometricum TaxID=472368 RepID=A0A2Z7D3B0_9LAMI|nr:hypothetical protein F511_14143 [Dorcoceras hygrometricum]